MPQRFTFSTPRTAPVDPLVAALLRGGQGPARTNLEGLGRLAQTLSGALVQRQNDVRGREEQAAALSSLLASGGQTVIPPEEDITAGLGSDIVAGGGVSTVAPGPLEGVGFDAARDVLGEPQPQDQGFLASLLGGSAPSQAKIDLARTLVSRGFGLQDADREFQRKQQATEAAFGRQLQLADRSDARADKRLNTQLSAADRRAAEDRRLRRDLAAQKEDQFVTDAGKALADVSRAERIYGPDSPQAAALRESAKTPTGPAKLTDVAGLRKEHTNLSKSFIIIRDSFRKIAELSKNPSPAGDLGLVFNIMKMFDPGSVVRESEFATAQNAAGVPERIRNLWNRTLSGEKLTASQRVDFVNTANTVFESQLASQRNISNQFKGIAERLNIDPANVVIDFTVGVPRADVDAVVGLGGDFDVPGGSGEAPATDLNKLEEALRRIEGR